MKVDRILYQKIFPTGMAYLNHKIGVEIQVEEKDDWEECFQLAKRMVEQWNLESNPSYAMAMEYMKPAEEMTPLEISKVVKKSEEENKNERIQSFIDTINMCTSLKFLENFEKRVKEENNDDLTHAYMKKHEELYKAKKVKT